MAIELIQASVFQHDTLLRNLFQFYVYEMSRFMTDWRVTEGGRFLEQDLDGCWTSSKRDNFIITVDGGLAGFALVDHDVTSYFGDEKPVNQMAEFFIMAALQKRGIGEEVALRLFKRYPGKWEVHQMEKNFNAQRFWRRVIGAYTSSNYTEQIYERSKGTVQIFQTV